MIDNFTDWASNNEKVVAAGDVFMNRLNSEQKRILAEVYCTTDCQSNDFPRRCPGYGF